MLRLLPLPLAVLLTPQTALPCGGMFCSVSPPGPTFAPAPVDQTAERIVFEVGTGTITAHVQIQYAGDATAFAWVVPVPSVPDVAESDDALFDELGQFSALQVLLPADEPCPPPMFTDGGGDDSGFGCGDSGGDNAPLARLADAGAAPPTPKSTVIVHDQSYTDNYEYVVLSAQDVNELVTWLQDNDYNVSDNMTPVMSPYSEEGMLFLALKLRAGRDASDIVPLRFAYSGDKPMIPIRLTAVAAQPAMGILVHILADTGYRVAAPFTSMNPEQADLLYDLNGRTNFFEWVSRKAAEAEGRWFFNQFRSGVTVRNASERGRQVLSTFYTRLSPEHMTADPVFEQSPDGSSIGALVDLTAAPALRRCGQPIDGRQPSACAFNYCGLGSTCVDNGLQVGCICAEGQVASNVMGPDGVGRVVCVPKENPYGITPEAGGAGTPMDPCASRDCGAGACVLRSGFATCECDAGATAVTSALGPECVTLAPNAETFGPGAGRESRGLALRDRPRRSISFYAGVWGLLALALFLRRRRR